jgi:hypothetical protein
MPVPDIVFQFALAGLPCPGDNQLQSIENDAQAAVPLGRATRALASCSDRPDLGGNVLSIGVWAADGGESVDQLENDLIAAGSLTRGMGIALLFGANAIQILASAGWAKVPKRLDSSLPGFARLSNDISVVIAGDQIVTTVTGQYKVRFVPNIPFTLKWRNRLSVNDSGPVPPLKSTSSLSLSSLAFTVLASVISPLFGALVFWQGSSLSFEPTVKFHGVGDVLAAQWPPDLLLPAGPASPPGKLAFIWMNPVTVDERGVTTQGYISPDTNRHQTVHIDGPTRFNLQLPTHTASPTYRLITQDLRGTLAIQWTIDGTPAGNAATLEVELTTPGLDPGTVVRWIHVEVFDEDGLEAHDDVIASLNVTVPPGRQPF